MADLGQVTLLRQGIKAWNAWRSDNPATAVDLSSADLSGADLSGIDLSGAPRAILTGASLAIADLSGANLSRANLSAADLSEANLSGADLSEASLFRTDLSGANLSGARVLKTVLVETVLGNLDLRAVVGLDTCVHLGPSTVDHRTLVQSGELPLAFLRGCGLSDRLIEYLPSLLKTSVQFYSCFISYSTADQMFADRLHADLQNKGVRCYYAPHDIKGGRKLHEQIDEAIRMYDKLLLILSPASMNSDWVKTEISKARRRETRHQQRVLFPVRLVAFDALRDWECFDSDIGKDSAKEIREYFIPDFSDWKNHDAYTMAFERLLHDLQSRYASRVT